MLLFCHPLAWEPYDLKKLVESDPSSLSASNPEPEPSLPACQAVLPPIYRLLATRTLRSPLPTEKSSETEGLSGESLKNLVPP